MGRTAGTLERRGRRRDVAIVVALAVVAVGLVGYLIAGAVGSGRDGEAAGTPSAGETAAIGPLGDLARRQEGDPLALGRTDAPVIMTIFSDYRCPFCAKFSRETEQQLIDEYVDDGRLRLEWRDYPIFGPESTVAAHAGRAAALQGKFWEYNRTVYADTPERTKPDLPEDTLLAYAEQAGIADTARFRADMDSPEVAEAVAADLAEGSALGVPSTPAFVVNGYPIMGAQPVEAFRAQIDQALETAP
ncbi:DsbA family protein [Pseudonocardia parietis]|uniref:Protein-disulfide isomerase n=1 Tax=Pseudonocardia parietis TaxID=570936 RepID=A0ABS4W723_9PSEU|nr:thioredoxin domain-containing protein [Pseudonocardia parietis]MBP2372012.1 protein-disulfide isomerase [Pseudonocardia parietis]